MWTVKNTLDCEATMRSLILWASLSSFLPCGSWIWSGYTPADDRDSVIIRIRGEASQSNAASVLHWSQLIHSHTIVGVAMWHHCALDRAGIIHGTHTPGPAGLNTRHVLSQIKPTLHNCAPHLRQTNSITPFFSLLFIDLSCDQSKRMRCLDVDSQSSRSQERMKIVF